MKKTVLLLALCASLPLSNAFADDRMDEPRAGYDTSHENRDNTAVNARDRQEHAKTADSQSMGTTQTELAANIRSKVVANDSLSTYGKNVKIIVTDDHTVTLKGPVHTKEERETIEKIARQEAGKSRVINQLEIEHK